MAGNSPDPGAKRSAPKVKTFSCPGCGASVTVRAIGRTISAICGSCKSILDVTNDTYRILQSFKDKETITPRIPLGTRGKLFGKEWEVIGFVERKVKDEAYYWDEYLLFNPRYGYRWLTVSNNHWNFVEMLTDKPVRKRVGGAAFRYLAIYEGNEYELFVSGKAEVNYVLGEFYWRVKVGDTVETEDFIMPPYMLSREKDKSEETWSLARYIEPHEIEMAFSLRESLPAPEGIAPNQPSVYLTNASTVIQLTGVFVGLLVLIQIIHTLLAANEVVFDSQYVYYTDRPNPEVTTPAFDLKHGLGNADIKLFANVNNNWLSLEGELVNEQTGMAYPFEATASYYHGREGGEFWSEGSKNAGFLIPSLPDGRYHLNFQPQAELNRFGSLNYTVQVKRNVPIWWNFFWTLLFLVAPPLLFWWRGHHFETQRWYESDFGGVEGDYGEVNTGDDD